MEEFERVDASKLRTFVVEVLEKMGVSPSDAAITADVLVKADLRGVDSHGVARLKGYYVDSIRNGFTRIVPERRKVHETPTTVVYDANAGLGMPIGVTAMNECIEKASKVGIGMAAVGNSNHFGIAGYYAMLALPHDMIGICFTNSAPLVVPTFGRKVMLGTNPICVAVPAKEERPFVLDMATSIVPRGKLEIYARKKEPLPLGWAADETGLPTTDAAKALEKVALMPLGGSREMGGHKGYGLAVMVDIFCGLLAGCAVGAAVARTKISHFFGAIRIDAFQPADAFKESMDEMMRQLRESPKAEGQDRIYVAGEIEYENEEERRKLGIPLHPEVLTTLRGLAQELGVEPV